MKYQIANHQTDLVVKDETARRLKVRGAVVRDENDSLKDQLSQRDTKIIDLVQQSEMARNKLDNAIQKSSRQEKQLRSQTREIANMKVCIFRPETPHVSPANQLL